MPGMISDQTNTPKITFMPPLEPITHGDVMNVLSRLQRIIMVIPLGIALVPGWMMISSGTPSIASLCVILAMVMGCHQIFLLIRRMNTRAAYRLRVANWLPTADMPPVPAEFEDEDLIADDVTLVKLIASKEILDGHKAALLQEMDLPDTLDTANIFLAKNKAWNWEMEQYCLRVQDHAEVLESYLANPR